MADETNLVISGVGVQPYSARGLTQTLELVEQAAYLRRTVNGALKDLSSPQFRKYRSVISCSDFEAPALDGVWPGQQLVIDCAAELSYKTAGGSPGRVVVPGSSRVDGDFTFYRPRLTVRVVSFNQSDEEYASVVAWTLEVEEV